MEIDAHEYVEFIPKCKPQKSKEQKMEEIKKKLLDSKVNYNITTENNYMMNSIKECLQTIKILDKTVRSMENKNLCSIATLGQAILKVKDKYKHNYREFLKLNGIDYTVSHLNTIIRISKLADDHNTILTFGLSFHYVNVNYKLIKEICIKNKW